MVHVVDTAFEMGFRLVGNGHMLMPKLHENVLIYVYRPFDTYKCLKDVKKMKKQNIKIGGRVV